ncbi:unnamed protein product, partial [Prorocentrum cordatum]
RLAQEMSREMKLTHCVNAFVDNDGDMPDYGQLGCQGFIVLDREHKAVARSTSPFMQVRELAFRHVEALLDAVVAGLPPPAVCPGEFVELIRPPEGRPDLRGAAGVVVELRGEPASPTLVLGFQDGPLRGRAMEVPAAAVARISEEEEEEEEEACGEPSLTCSGPGCSAGGGCAAPCGESGACGTQPCSKGSCGSCAGAAPAVAPELVAAALSIPSVKVPSMDAEHAECADALRLLVAEGSRAALASLLDTLASHFAHEEALFEQFGWGRHANASLAAAVTHAADHRRMLEKVQKQLAVAGASVSPAFVQEVLQDFHEHATKYDARYAEPLSELGAR